MNTYIALLIVAVVLLSPIASAAEPGPQAPITLEARFIVVGPSAGEALRLLGVKPLVDAGELAAAILEPWQVSRLRAMGYSVAIDPVVRLVEPLALGVPQQAASPQSYADLVNAGPLHQQGVTGGGVIVAVVDTGVDEARPELSGKEAWEYDATETGQQGYCGKGLGLPYSAHGTMVAGIIFSSDQQLRGVAPDATLYDVIIARPEFGCGGAYLSDIYNGILAAARGPDRQLGTEDDADVINLSFGTVALPWNWYYIYSPIDDLSTVYAELVRLMEELRHDYGINIVVAGGNAGPATSSVNPFCAAALCAGSIQRLTGATSFFSSRGPDAFLRPAPHVVAPGEDLTVLLPLEFGSTTMASGTSFSAPLASGTLALLRQLLPNTSALDLEALLVAGGQLRSLVGWDIPREGGTRVDAAGAAERLVAASFLVEGFTRAEAQYPTATVWSGSQVKLRVVNLRDTEVTLAVYAQVLPGSLAPAASGQASANPPALTLAPGETGVVTVTASSQEPGVAGVLIRLVDSATGEVVAVAVASLAEPLEPGERLSLETSIYDWGFLPVPIRAGSPGVYSLNIYSYTLPVETVVWDGTGPDSTPATLFLSGNAIAFLNPLPFIAAYPLAAIVKVDVSLEAVTLTDLSGIYARLSELEDKLDLLEARVNSLESQLERLDLLEAELEEVGSQLDQAKARLEALEARIAEQEAVNEEQWNAINEVKARLSLLEERVGNVESEIEELRSSIAELSSNVNVLSLRVERLQERTAKLEGELDEVSQRVAGLSTRLTMAEEKISGLEDSLKEASLKILQLEKGLEEARSELAGIQSEMAGLAGDIARLQEELSMLEEETERAVRELKSSIDGLNGAIASLRSDAEQLADRLSKAEERLAKAEDSLASLTAQIASASQTIAGLGEKLAALESRVGAQEEAVKGLEEELVGIKSKLDNVEAAIEALQEAQGKIEEELNMLEEEQRSSRIASGAALALGAAAGLAILGLAARRLLSEG